MNDETTTTSKMHDCRDGKGVRFHEDHRHGDDWQDQDGYPLPNFETEFKTPYGVHYGTQENSQGLWLSYHGALVPATRIELRVVHPNGDESTLLIEDPHAEIRFYGRRQLREWALDAMLEQNRRSIEAASGS